MSRCKKCIHWDRNGNFQSGFCNKINSEIEIELETGWDGGFVSYIETDENFGCTCYNEA